MPSELETLRLELDLARATAADLQKQLDAERMAHQKTISQWQTASIDLDSGPTQVIRGTMTIFPPRTNP